MPGIFDASKLPTSDEQEQGKALDLTQGFAVQRNPDQAAKAFELSKTEGISFEAAEAKLASEPTLEIRRKVSWDALVREAPVLAERLADPGRAAAVHDDVENLHGIEKLFGGITHLPQQVGAAMMRGEATRRLANVGWKELLGEATPEDLEAAKRTEALAAEYPEEKLGLITGILPAAAESAAISVQTLLRSAPYAAAGAAVGAGIGVGAGALAGGVGAAPGAVAGAGTGGTWGWRAGTAIESGKMEGGLAYREFRGLPGVTPEAARGAALAVGVVNGALESVGLESIFKVAPALKSLVGRPGRAVVARVLRDSATAKAFAGFARHVATAGITEGLTEALQELSSVVGGAVASAPRDTDIGEAIGLSWQAAKAQSDRIVAAGVKGAQGGIGMAGASGLTGIQTDLAKARAAKERQGFYEQLGGLAQGSTSRTRLPAEYQAYVDALVQKYGTMEQVTIPADKLTKLFQAENLSPEEIQEKMPKVAEQLNDATRDPTMEVSVSMSDLATHLAGMKGFESLHKDIRVGNEPTISEADRTITLAQEVLSKIGPNATEVADSPVFTDVREKMTALGFAPNVADKYAGLWSAFIGSRAQRTGVTPEEYYKGINLSVARSDIVQAIVGQQESLLTPRQLELKERALKGDSAALDALEESLLTDELTGANAPSTWKRYAARKAPGVYLSIDVNDLKRVNDTLGGHEAGDTLLKAVADALKPAVRGMKGKFFRAGGDEFSAHFLDRPSADAAVAAITKAMNELPALFGGQHKASITLGIGPTFSAADVAAGKAKAQARAAGRSGWGRPGAVETADLTKGDVFLGEGFDLAQDTRGQITFDDSASWFEVTLGGKADLSTFLHESGHAFLEILRRDARGNEQAAADLALVETWLGVKGVATQAQLETFARGFEAYLMEGKAPSSELVGIFAAFKGWLKLIYQAIRRLDVNLTDEVRGVMDRMLASDYEIENARQGLGLSPSLTPAELTPAELQAFQARYNKAIDAKRAELEQESIRDLKRALADAKDTIRSQVQAEALMNKDFNAYSILTTGKPLDPSATMPEGLEGVKLLRSEVHRKGKRVALTTSESGVAPEVLAPMLGYATGEDLIRAVFDGPSLERWVRQETNRRMVEQHPESQVAALAEAAVEKLHDPSVDLLLEMEFNAFGRMTGAKPLTRPIDVLTAAARERVQALTIPELTPGKYARAEARCARESFEAGAKKDYATAMDAKRRQMFYRAMHREVTSALSEVEKTRKYLKTFESMSVRKILAKAGGDYLNAIDALLDGIEFTKVSDRAIARRKALGDYLNAMEADGDTVAIPPELRAEAGLKNYREMTAGELNAVRDAVKNLEHLARFKHKMLVRGEYIQFKETVVRISEHIKANVGQGVREPIGELRTWDKAKAFMRKARANLTKIEFLARALDGGQTAGYVHSLVFQPLADAQAAEFEMSRQVSAKLTEALRKLTLADRIRHDRTVEFLGNQLRVKEVLACILNTGNAGNFKKLLKGFGWEEPAFKARVEALIAEGAITQDDLTMVQSMWDTIDSLWPEVSALAKRTVGFEPSKVEAKAVTYGGTTLKGGYYPVVYNRRLSHKAEQHAQRRDPFENNFLIPSTEKGFIESRTEYFAPIQLSLDIIPAHIQEVIHYITHYEAVRNVDRIVASTEVRDAITTGVGREMFQLFRPWLQAIANDRAITDSTKFYDAILRRLRLGSSIAYLGFKITTGLKQVFGLATSAKELGGKYTVAGARVFLSKLASGTPFEELTELSAEFKDIDRQHDREISAVLSSNTSAFSAYGQLKENLSHFALAWMMLNQKVVNAVTWYGAREKALAEGHDRPEDYADSIVRMTQSGGGLKDLAAVQRGSELEKTMTVMYTYFSVALNQLMEAIPGKSGGQKMAIMAARWWWLVTLPVMLDAVVGVGVPDDDKDKEKYLEALTTDQLLYAGRFVPFAGSVAESFLSDREARFGAWTQTLLKGAASTGRAAEGKATAADVRNMVDLLGAATGMPSTAMKNAYRYLEEFHDGTMEEPVQNLLFRSPGSWE